jgi:hypothetical protein
MAVQSKLLLLAAIAFSFLSFRYAPSLAFFPTSSFWNVASLYLLLESANLAWSIVVYPLFVSPLRHLPQPSVCEPPKSGLGFQTA